MRITDEVNSKPNRVNGGAIGEELERCAGALDVLEKSVGVLGDKLVPCLSPVGEIPCRPDEKARLEKSSQAGSPIANQLHALGNRIEVVVNRMTELNSLCQL